MQGSTSRNTRHLEWLAWRRRHSLAYLRFHRADTPRQPLYEHWRRRAARVARGSITSFPGPTASEQAVGSHTGPARFDAAAACATSSVQQSATARRRGARRGVEKIRSVEVWITTPARVRHLHDINFPSFLEGDSRLRFWWPRRRRSALSFPRQTSVNTRRRVGSRRGRDVDRTSSRSERDWDLAETPGAAGYGFLRGWSMD